MSSAPLDRIVSSSTVPPDGCGIADLGASEPEFLAGLVRGMRCGILVVDYAGTVVLANDPAVQILELDRTPVPGEPVEVALAAYPQLARVLTESFSMSSLPNRAEIDLELGADARKTIGLTLSMVKDAAGSPRGAAIFFKDLTHVEHKQEQERLRDRLAALGEMAANLAHEIRNPLASIEVTCSLLKRRLREGDGSREMLQKIVAEIHRLNRTITSSLEYVRPLRPTLAVHDLHDVLDHAIDVAQSRRSAPGVEVAFDRDPSLRPFAFDRTRLREVFENLFLNALEAMGQEGRLDVATATCAAPAAAMTPYRPPGSEACEATREFDRYAVITIRDTGPGIAAEHIDKLFHPFFTTKKDGSGVGLAMARKFVDIHGGLIDVRSAPGQGATFEIKIPVPRTSSEECAR